MLRQKEQREIAEQRYKRMERGHLMDGNVERIREELKLPECLDRNKTFIL